MSAKAAAEVAQEKQHPMVTIVAGRPDAEELAALVAVLSAVGGGGTTEPERPRSAWSDPARHLGRAQPRRGGWRASSLPR